MIIEEKLNNDLVRHFSDRGVYIRQVETGIEYAEAIDAIPCRYTYEETENQIIVPDEPMNGGTTDEIEN